MRFLREAAKRFPKLKQFTKSSQSNLPSQVKAIYQVSGKRIHWSWKVAEPFCRSGPVELAIPPDPRLRHFLLPSSLRQRPTQ
jgi:hypothetical protein